MDVSLKSSVNSSVAAHTGYSWKGLPPDLRSPTISSDPHGRNHQVHSNYIRPIASSREQRTDHWQGKKPDGFLGPPAASGPNWRQSQPFGIGDRAPIPAARPTHIRQGLPIPKPSYEDRWSNIGFENDSVKGQDVPPSSGFRSLHGTYDNSWYSPSPQSYCARADTFQNKTSGTSSDPQPTGKRSPRKRCIRIIVVVVLAAVIASVVTALVFYLRPKDEPDPSKTPVKQVFLNEPAVMEFKMAEPASVDQLDILRGEDHLFTLNVTGNTTVSPPGQRMRVDIRISTDSLTVTLTLMNVTCTDEGSYVVIARGKEREERKTVVLKVSRRPHPPVLEIPNYIVESRTTDIPVCRVSSLGYPPLKLVWLLRRPGGSERTLEASQLISISPRDCDSTDNSVLDAQNYVSWNGSDLCCQLINTTNSNSVVKETCKTLVVLPAVEMDSDPVADIDEPYSLRCRARKVSGDAQVKIHHKDQLLASFSTSALSGDANTSKISIGGRLDGDMLTVTLNFTKITCADGGSYTCSVNDSGVDTNATVNLAIRRPPTEPILKVPDAAEGVTAVNPTCRVTSFGYNPVMTLTWVLKRPDGSEETKATYGSNSPKVTKYDDTCNSTIAETVLDAMLYVGWNNTELCCQVTDPQTSTIVKEKCEMIRLIPGDYCGENDKHLPYPYDTCDKWVECDSTIEHIKNCGGTGLCYNIDKDACEYHTW